MGSNLSFLRDLRELDLRRLSDLPAPLLRAEAALPQIPGYAILGELGRGGAGVVYHARHRVLGRPVAIKMLHPGLFPSEADRRRLRAEAEAVARLQHPNVVQLYEIGETGGVALPRPGVRLRGHARIVPGRTAAAAEGGRRPGHRAGPGRPRGPPEANHPPGFEAGEHLAASRRDGGRGGSSWRNRACVVGPLSPFDVPKITDFGLAKRLDRTVSGLTQTLSGTPAYMSPEQIPERAGEPPATPVTPATDVYALGVILYEMLTGRPPFLGTDWVATLLQVVRRAPVPPRELQPGTPRDLQTICLKCLEKEPGKRYATAEELADDLGRFLDHKPIRARPVGLLGRLRRWGRRNPVPAGSLAALVATGLFALTAILWQWKKAEALAKSLADRQCPVRGATPPGGRRPGASRAGRRRSPTTRRGRAPRTLSVQHRGRRSGPATPK